MTDIDRPQGKLELRRVVSDTFAVIAHRPVALFGPAAAWSALILSLRYMGVPGFMPTTSMFTNFNPMFLGFVLINLVVALAIRNSQIYIAVGDLDGRRPGLREILPVSMRKLLPILGLSILMGLGIGLGWLLLLVPGIILLVMWIAAYPALIAEPINVIEAFGRSRTLTRGNRWRIFGLLLLLLVLILIFEASIIATAGGVAALAAAAQGANLVTTTLIAVGGIALGGVGYVGAAALYVQLRDLKAGGAGRAAAVFE